MVWSWYEKVHLHNKEKQVLPKCCNIISSPYTHQPYTYIRFSICSYNPTFTTMGLWCMSWATNPTCCLHSKSRPFSVIISSTSVYFLLLTFVWNDIWESKSHLFRFRMDVGMNASSLGTVISFWRSFMKSHQRSCWMGSICQISITVSIGTDPVVRASKSVFICTQASAWVVVKNIGKRLPGGLKEGCSSPFYLAEDLARVFERIRLFNLK